MGRVGDLIFVIAVLGGLAAWVIWGWVTWVRRRPTQLTPGMTLSAIGFGFASLSALLQIGTGLYANLTGGFPFNDPKLMRIYGIGLLSALLGLACGLGGMFRESPLRFKAPILSAFLLLFWALQAISE
jgi:hypothetical protein